MVIEYLHGFFKHERAVPELVKAEASLATVR